MTSTANGSQALWLSKCDEFGKGRTGFSHLASKLIYTVEDYMILSAIKTLATFTKSLGFGPGYLNVTVPYLSLLTFVSRRRRLVLAHLIRIYRATKKLLYGAVHLLRPGQ